MRVLRSWEHFSGASNERTWVYAIVRNCLREHYRARSSDRLHRSGVAPESLSLAQNGDFSDRQALLAAIEGLSLPQRQIFILRAVQEISGREAAQALGWSESKARVTLHRAMKSLREVLAHE